MLSGNCQAGRLFGVVDAGLFPSNAFHLTSGIKLDLYRSKYFEIEMVHPRLSGGESILLIHTQRATADCYLRHGNYLSVEILQGPTKITDLK